MIEKNSLGFLIINLGEMGEPTFTPDIARLEAVKAGGGDLGTLASCSLCCDVCEEGEKRGFNLLVNHCPWQCTGWKGSTVSVMADIFFP